MEDSKTGYNTIKDSNTGDKTIEGSTTINNFNTGDELYAIVNWQRSYQKFKNSKTDYEGANTGEDIIESY